MRKRKANKKINRSRLNIIGIIPARMGSSRFPGKPLARINGLTMVEHVYNRSKMARCLDDVYVATCDEEIKREVEDFGGKVVMTKASHDRASDRVAEAMLKIEKQLKASIDIVVMIQGDEPMVFPQMIEAAVRPLIKDKDIKVVNLMAESTTPQGENDFNEIKVVVNQD